MAKRATWHGSDQEAHDLAEAIEHHCACNTSDATIGGIAWCGPHDIASDQRTLDRLLFVRRIRARLLGEEMEPSRVGAISE